MQKANDIPALTDHLFRREAGRMVSVLTKIFGAENLEIAEDVVQDTLIDAMEVWKLKGIPDNPSAWLFRVAKNKAIDIIRRHKHSVRYDFNDSERILLTSEYTLVSVMENFWTEEAVSDDMLRMMFICCHPELSQESQVTLILKTLCAFSTAEIANAFLTSEDVISKRLYRSKEFFRKRKIKLAIPSAHELSNRIDAVHRAIYLLFNEGYSASQSQNVIRKDLLDEAMLLCRLLTENSYTKQPETFALMALMYFHVSRNDSRLTPEGEIILLQHQDRRKWNAELIAEGNRYMNMAAFGNTLSAYHLEAAIVYEHCIARTFEQTRWARIVELYEWLCAIAPSPITEVHKAAAIMQQSGAEAALQAIANIQDTKKLEAYYLYHSLLGEVYVRLGNPAEAKARFITALGLTNSEAEKKILQHKILSCGE